MSVPVYFIDPQKIAAVEQQLLDIYRAAFKVPSTEQGEQEMASFAQTLHRHAGRDGFRCLIAQEHTEEPILGFAYGYTSGAGQWWHDRVAPALDETARAFWLADAFEVVELAVLPSAQGQGIGGKLHDALLTGLPHRTAVLSTEPGETNAMHLYRKRGWLPLLQVFYFPGDAAPSVILG